MVEGQIWLANLKAEITVYDSGNFYHSTTKIGLFNEIKYLKKCQKWSDQSDITLT